MTAPRSDQPVPMLKATRTVLRLSLRGLARNRRSAFLVLLLGLPVLIALVQRLAARSQAHGADLYGLLVAGYYVGSFVPFVGKALPLAALFFAAALISDEVEGRTLVYFLTRPIPRASVVVGKFAAALVWTMGAACVSLVLVFALTTPSFSAALQTTPRLLRDLAVAFAALASYGALFALLGVLLRRPLLPGILFLYVWEWLARITQASSHLTLGTALESLLSRDTLPRRLAWLMSRNTVPLGESLAVVTLVTLGGVVLASYLFSRREYASDR